MAEQEQTQVAREYIGPGERGATFSPCRRYRYSLWRRWGGQALVQFDCQPWEMVAFVGLNPSTADELKNDNTVAKCIGYAKRWGFGGMCMLNAFAYRATDPKRMKLEPSPIGPENDIAIDQVTRKVARVVCCWGTHAGHQSREMRVRQILRESAAGRLHCFGMNMDGSPKHPLYLSNTTETVIVEF